MGIFDAEAEPKQVALRIHDGLRSFISNPTITTSMHENEIILRASKKTLTITWDSPVAFRVKDDNGYRPDGALGPNQVGAPTHWSDSDPPITESEMVRRVRTWLNEQPST
jgi:hypothetical protein